MSLIHKLASLKSVCKKTDIEVIGDLLQDMDVGQPWITSDNNHIWNYVVCQEFNPRKIFEIGNRFGYGLKALVDGAGHPEEEYHLWSVDCEWDGIPCNYTARKYFEDYHFNQINAYTLDCYSLRITDKVDLAYVDANDTQEDTYRNCILAIECLKPGGIMLVGDLDNEQVKLGLETFCEDYRLEYESIPSFSGMGILRNASEWESYLTCQLMDHDMPQKNYLLTAIKSDMTVLDVGCNQAEYSRLFTRLAKRVVAFEPSKRDYNYIKKEFPDLEVHRLALGNEEKEVNLYCYDDFVRYGYNSTTPPLQKYEHRTHIEKVQMTTFDKWFEKNDIGPIHFVKVDIEGDELDFFKGANKLLEMRPIIMCELRSESGTDAQAVVDYIGGGYVWYGVHEDGSLFPTLSEDDNAAEHDFIAIPKGFNVMVPPGIGDSVWAMIKIQDLAKKLAPGEKINLRVQCHYPDATIEKRSLEFLSRFRFINSTMMHRASIHRPGRMATPKGYYNYIPDGDHPDDEIDFAMIPNAALERGQRLESWLPDYKCNWNIMDDWRFAEEDLEYGPGILREHGPYIIFYLGPLMGNCREFSGHNRGPMWTPRQWIDLGDRLHNLHDVKIAVVGAAWDASYYNQKIIPLLGNRDHWVNKIEQTSIGELLSLTQHSRYMVSYQSGIAMVPSYMGVPSAIFWRPKGNSINAKTYISFEEDMATSWVDPQMLKEGKFLPLIYGRHGPRYITEEIKRRNW